MYDSLCSSVSNKTIHLIASMVYSSSSTLEVRMMDVAKQSNSSDCGILAIAYGFDLCSGYDPCEVKYDHKKSGNTWSCAWRIASCHDFLCCANEKAPLESLQRQLTFTVHVVCLGKVMTWLNVIHAMFGIIATAWTFLVRCLIKKRTFIGSVRPVVLKRRLELCSSWECTSGTIACMSSVVLIHACV